MRPLGSLVVKRVAIGVLWAAAAALLTLHIVAVRTETVNWDEFGLLARAQEALRTGHLSGGGRPGLATLAAIPAVRGCTNAVAAVRTARYEWIGFTLLMLGGAWTLLRTVCRHAASPALCATAGLGLLAFVPVFQRWSLQARADQPALAASLWGGVILLHPKRGYLSAVLAGALFGVGYLCSQKAVYVGLLLAVLAAGDVLSDTTWQQRREERRALCFAGGALASIAIYRLSAASVFSLPPAADVQNIMESFAGYRATIGFHPYVAMLPTLVPHAILAVLLASASWRQRAFPAPRARDVAWAWSVAAAGIAVGLFHAATFPYFWMTLGLFPAFALALGFDAALETLGRQASRTLLVGSLGLVLLVPTLRAGILMLDDSQEPQRLALAFVDRNFRTTDRGFHPESALFCREDPDPFPTYFSQDIGWNFYRAGSGERVRAFLQEFRARPVAFLVGSFRLDQFPPEIRQFWSEHYVSYRDNVFVPGREIRGRTGARISFDAIVTGPYRWLPAELPSARCVSVDGRPVAPGEPVALSAGAHAVDLACDARGSMALAIRDTPGGTDARPFYGLAMMQENSGVWIPGP